MKIECITALYVIFGVQYEFLKFNWIVNAYKWYIYMPFYRYIMSTSYASHYRNNWGLNSINNKNKNDKKQ